MLQPEALCTQKGEVSGELASTNDIILFVYIIRNTIFDIFERLSVIPIEPVLTR